MEETVRFRKDTRTCRIGETNTNTQGCLMKIIEYKNCGNIVVEFQDKYKTKIKSAYREFQKGIVKNNFYPSVCGVGYLGTSEVSIKRKINKSYAYWRGMLVRCYDEKYKKKKPSYKDCVVCDEWHNYSNFKKWFDENYYTVEEETMTLDKDILINNNKVYSPNTCIFVPLSINDLFSKGNRSERNKHLGIIGVTVKNGKYFCTVGKNHRSFSTKEDAFLEYKKYKENRIMNVANKYKNKIPSNIYNILINYRIEE